MFLLLFILFYFRSFDFVLHKFQSLKHCLECLSTRWWILFVRWPTRFFSIKCGTAPNRWRFVRGHDKPIHGSCVIYLPGGIIQPFGDTILICCFNFSQILRDHFLHFPVVNKFANGELRQLPTTGQDRPVNAVRLARIDVRSIHHLRSLCYPVQRPWAMPQWHGATSLQSLQDITYMNMVGRRAIIGELQNRLVLGCFRDFWQNTVWYLSIVVIRGKRNKEHRIEIESQKKTWLQLYAWNCALI